MKQGELFDHMKAAPGKLQGEDFVKQSSMDERFELRLSADKMVFLLLVILIFLIVVFTLGVEHGKRLQEARLRTERDVESITNLARVTAAKKSLSRKRSDEKGRRLDKEIARIEGTPPAGGKPTKSSWLRVSFLSNKEREAEKQLPIAQPEKPKEVAPKPEVSKPPEPAPAKTTAGTAAHKHYIWGTGRRKASVARVRIKTGDGKFIVNKKEVKEYFCIDDHRRTVHAPLQATESGNNFDVFVNVCGGGITGQAGAISLGLSRALAKIDPELEAKLREKKLMTRDPRRVERKKYGQPGARKRFQFSKR